MIIDSLSLKDRIVWMIYHNLEKTYLSWGDFVNLLPNNNRDVLKDKLKILIDEKNIIEENIDGKIIYNLTKEGKRYYEKSIAKLVSLNKVILKNPLEKVFLQINDIKRTSTLNDDRSFTYYSNITCSSFNNSIIKFKIDAQNKDQMINKIWKKLNIRCPLFFYNHNTNEIIEGKVYPTFFAKMNVTLGSGRYLFKKKERINKNP